MCADAGSKGCILHIDDDPVLLRLARVTLTRSGYDLESTEHPPDTSTAWEKYQLLIVDWLLPESDGLSICEQARAAGYSGPILMLSSKDLSREEQYALEDVDAQFMSKPFGPHALILRVREVLSAKE